MHDYQAKKILFILGIFIAMLCFSLGLGDLVGSEYGFMVFGVLMFIGSICFKKW